MIERHKAVQVAIDVQCTPAARLHWPVLNNKTHLPPLNWYVVVVAVAVAAVGAQHTFE